MFLQKHLFCFNILPLTSPFINISTLQYKKFKLLIELSLMFYGTTSTEINDSILHNVHIFIEMITADVHGVA